MEFAFVVVRATLIVQSWCLVVSVLQIQTAGGVALLGVNPQLMLISAQQRTWERGQHLVNAVQYVQIKEHLSIVCR
jgi:hypothetical protein